MAASHLAIAFTLAGIGIWALAFWWGPSFGYLDLETRRRLLILAGAVCFGAAGAVALWQAWG